MKVDIPGEVTTSALGEEVWTPRKGSEGHFSGQWAFAEMVGIENLTGCWPGTPLPAAQLVSFLISGLTLRGTLARAWAHVRCVRPVLEPHVGPQRRVQRWPWGALGQKDKVDAQGGRMRRWLLCELFFFKKSASQALLLSDKCLFLVNLGGPIKKGRGVTAGAAGQFAPARRVLPSPFYSESLIATQPNAGSGADEMRERPPDPGTESAAALLINKAGDGKHGQVRRPRAGVFPRLSPRFHARQRGPWPFPPGARSRVSSSPSCALRWRSLSSLAVIPGTTARSHPAAAA